MRELNVANEQTQNKSVSACNETTSQWLVWQDNNTKKQAKQKRADIEDTPGFCGPGGPGGPAFNRDWNHLIECRSLRV